MNRSGRRKVLLVLLMAIVALGVGWGRAWYASRAFEFDRIVLVTVDTLRADHVGCYGYPKPVTPFLDRLAAEGILYSRAFAPMATTSPSHATIFTSLYPVQHRVTKNGHILDDSFVTIAELLKTVGYDTAGFASTNHHFAGGNLARGFDTFAEQPMEDQRHYRPADETIAATITWLQARKSNRPLFLWIHLFDPHHPFSPPKRHLQPGVDWSHEHFSEFFHLLTNQHKVSLDFFDGDPNRMISYHNRYDAEVRFADEQLARLFDHFEQFGKNKKGSGS